MVRMLLFAALLCCYGCDHSPDAKMAVDVVGALSQDETMDCYAVADRPVGIAFPKDSGPHDTFKTEWWYYTGNLTHTSGRHFGCQLTFFRQALDCVTPSGTSKWRTRQLYFAHFAITDTQNHRFYSAQRMNRASLDIAGAQSDPFRVWIDNWQAMQQAGKGPGHLTLHAKAPLTHGENQSPTTIALTLNLIQEKPAILQGTRGWSPKGPGRSDASYYYSLPRLGATGNIQIGSQSFKVAGKVWFDHEWSTSALGKNVRGWDWFALHLTQGALAGTDLMVCQIRNADNRPNGFNFGSLSFKDGTYQILNASQFTITPLAHWTSPHTGKRFPSQWTITIPSHDMAFNIQTVIANQEHPHRFSYYEGAIRASGQNGSGTGYVEMTGYAAQ